MAVQRDPMPLAPGSIEFAPDYESKPISPVLAFEQLMAESDARQAAQPDDEWCALCGNKLGSVKSADGVVACSECAAEYLAAQAKYEAEMAEIAGLHFGPNRAQRRRESRKTRLRNNGAPYGG